MAAALRSDDKNYSKIIILGGGISGLSTASHLVKNGETDFMLLEASKTLGGRIHAVELDGTKLELGANWIHGVLGNPIYELASSHGLIDIVHAPKPHKVVAALSNGEQVPFGLLQEIYTAYQCFLRRCEEYFLCQYLPPDGINSVGEHIRYEIELYLKQVKDPREKQLRNMVFECLLKRESCITGCDDMNEVDLLELGSYTELQGGNIMLPGGYSSILKPIVSVIPPRNIYLEKQAVNVRWLPCAGSECDDAVSSPGYDSGIDVIGGDAQGDADNGSDDSDRTITITCKERTAEESSCPTEPVVTCDNIPPIEVICQDGSKYLCSHLVCTLPLGVLKEQSHSLFAPPLPPAKQDAIDALAFGTVNKIFLAYSRPFLHPEISEIMLLWDENGDGKPDITINWFKKIYSFTRVSDTIVLGWLSGLAAEYIETLAESEIAEKCTWVLRQFLGDPYIPLPKRCVCSKWKSDKLFRGSYTSLAIGASQLDIEQVAAPLYATPTDPKPRLLFAGEHTHSNFYSTVHGAYLSGRCASQILLSPDNMEEQLELECDDDTSDLSSWIQGINLN